MTKQYDGNIWTETDSRGVVKIGFSRTYIDQQLMECFHVMQADRSVARKGLPIMVLETNDGTARIKSPVSGRILTFNDKARNFPDRLSEEDVIMEVLPEGVKLEPTKKKVEYKDFFNQVNVVGNNWNGGRVEILDDIAPAAPPVVDRQAEAQRELQRRLEQQALRNVAERARRRVR